MSEHLSEDQICRCVAGEAAPEEWAHLAACRDCEAQVAQGGLALRSFGAAARRWSGAQVGQSDRAPVRSGGMLRPLGALRLVVLMVVGVYFSAGTRAVPRPAQVALDDAALLNEVSADVQRAAPQSLMPFLQLDPAIAGSAAE